MNKQIADIAMQIIKLSSSNKNLIDSISGLNHDDQRVKYHIDKLKKLSLSTLDVLNGVEKQLSFLGNEYKNFEYNENLKENREAYRRRNEKLSSSRRSFI